MKRCAIYSRVSTSMQNEAEYSSCEAQKDRIMSYIKSQEDLEFTKEYSDPAFSGKDLERPALKELLRDIAHSAQFVRSIRFQIVRSIRFKSSTPDALQNPYSLVCNTTI